MIDWDAFIASAKRGKPKAAANDGDIGIVRHDPQATGRKPFEFVRVGEIDYNEPDWLIDGLFEASALALLFGDPGTGKSFIAFDLSASVATGTPFHGRDVVQGAVFIIAGEGFSGLRRRFSAWEQGTGVLLNNAPLYVSNGAANFLDAESALRVAEAVAKLANKCPPRLIVVDTLARSFGDGDENNTRDMNVFVRAMDELRRDYPDATVLVVHHCGHAEKGRARGAMALKGALDAEYKTSKTGNIVTLSNTKMKEADTPKPMHFELVNVELGTDRHGEPFGSAWLKTKEGLNAGEAPPGFKGPALMLVNAYKRIASARDAAGEESGVPRKEWREAFYAVYKGKPSSARTIFSRNVKLLCVDAPTNDDGLCFLSASTIARHVAT